MNLTAVENILLDPVVVFKNDYTAEIEPNIFMRHFISVDDRKKKYLCGINLKEHDLNNPHQLFMVVITNDYIFVQNLDGSEVQLNKTDFDETEESFFQKSLVEDVGNITYDFYNMLRNYKQRIEDQIVYCRRL